MASKKYVRFEGNCPVNVSRDAKYSVKRQEGNYVVGILYRSDEGEIWYPSSEDHPELVEMVNEVKTHFTGNPGGAFYINEYHQVIVPVAGNEEGDYYLAGEYTSPIEFEFEDKTLSGDAKDLDGNRLKPGDRWVGPHPGIPYVLSAGGKDIYYKLWVRPQVEREERLSRHIGRTEAEEVALPIARIKGREGGRFYLNEFKQIFTPQTNEYGIEYIYVGKLEDMSKWFPKPHAG